MNKFTAPQYFVFSLLLLFFLPHFLAYDMFVDGVTYAAISRNLAIGDGTWFRLFYTETIHPLFIEHPPMAFWLHAPFYKVFGEHIIIDRLFGFFLTLGTGFIILNIWKKLNPKDHSLYWWPLFLFLSQGLTQWVVRNNLLEIPMTFFTALAGLFCVLSLQSKSLRASIKYSLLVFISVIFAVLCKGPVGFFPLAIPFFFWLSSPKSKLKWMLCSYGVGFGLLCLLIMLLPLLPEQAIEYSELYYNRQILRHILEHTAHAPGVIVGGNIFKHIINNLLLPFTLITIGFWVFRKSLKKSSEQITWGLVFSAIALSASLPILLASSQSGFYMYPSVPFYALAMAFLSKPLAKKLNISLNKKKLSLTVKWLAGFITVAATVMMFVRPTLPAGDSRQFVDDFPVSKFKLDINKKNQAGICHKELLRDWGPIAYLQRFYRISLFENLNLPLQLRLMQNLSCPEDEMRKLTPLNLSQKTKKYVLFKKQKSSGI